MPDGQPLSRYLTLETDDRRKSGNKRSKSGRKGPRGKDEMWRQWTSHSVRLRERHQSSGFEAAELEAVGRVGHRRRRRWLNDKLLRDMAGPMPAEEMEATFKPPPWGEDPKPMSFTMMLHQAGDLRDVLRSIDMDKQWLLLQEWENAVKSRTASKSKPERASQVALKKWAQISQGGRRLLKHADPHTVLDLEIPILDFKNRNDPSEELTMEAATTYTEQLIRSLSTFHALNCKLVSLPPGPGLHAVALRHRFKPVDSHMGVPSQPQIPDVLEITCTDVLLAMHEYHEVGLNDRLLEAFVINQIHGLGDDCN